MSAPGTSAESRNLLDHPTDEEDDFSDSDVLSPVAPGPGDQLIENIQSNLAEVTDSMRRNILGAVRRGEQLEEIAAQTDHLADTSSQFNDRARTLRREMRWKKMKIRLMIGLLILVFLAFFFWMVFG
ncbi:hypothetical protein H696_04500 [Fonticula alba]|uniref:V-SNARE coiled-coil homology domain-containing protein n=1 Tax=Fonticula alba TaxID=691883 RepID=A0A058Z4A4_FONAL|nr:hypothetical protein H696_04500 [Fonticula alba]KCV69085.1 hypothetical protein H696_04500 [Fonticula alba]|eukprot:XP_009496656.1 hypothetical protein H696_04500 [Fonticula alba]